MDFFTDTWPADKSELYRKLETELNAIVAGERDFTANTANCAALLFHALPDINWAGFYFLKNGELVLGPFQGNIACVRIGLDRGVCGAAASQRRTLIVPNVHEFLGHIACDSASNSEIVVPLLAGERLLGVLDIDSPLLSRFDAVDEQGLRKIVGILLAASDVESV